MERDRGHLGVEAEYGEGEVKLARGDVNMWLSLCPQSPKKHDKKSKRHEHRQARQRDEDEEEPAKGADVNSNIPI